jgi:DNA-binding MarR family transcriptional regulator
MPRAFDTFLAELYGTPRKDFAASAPDVPAQFAVLAALTRSGELSLVELQRESELPFTRFAHTLDALLSSGLIVLSRTDDIERAALTPTGSALMERE